MNISRYDVQPLLKKLLNQVPGDTVKLVTEDDISEPYTNDGVTIFVPKQLTGYSDLAEYEKHERKNTIKHLDLTEFEFVPNNDILELKRMFTWWSQLETVDFGHNKVECELLNVVGMFFGCHKLKEIDLSKFHTQHIRAWNIVSHKDVHIVMPYTYGQRSISGDEIHMVRQVTVQEGYDGNVRNIVTLSKDVDITTEFHIPESVVEHIGEEALEDLGENATVVIY